MPHEVFNGARTAAYLSDPSMAIDGINICDILEFGGCENNTMFPLCDGTDDWGTIDFTTPTADPAPWYNSGYPESADALGFFIEEWSGLDAGHVARSSTTWGGQGGGSSLGVSGSAGRVMSLNLLLFGRTEEAVQYLFDWLSSTFTGVCNTCASDSLLIRRFCGSTENPTKGIAELRNVGQTRGLKWESEPSGRANCMIRRASIVLEAGDPCMYLPDTERDVHEDDADADLADCFGDVNMDDEREFCRPSCSELALPCRTSRTFEVNPMAALAPVITWDNESDAYTYPFRAHVYYDPNEIGTTPNPCGLEILGEVYVRAMPPWSTLVWDVTGRRIQYRDVTTGGLTSGQAFIEANDTPNRRYFALPCGVAHLVMEPSSMCATDEGGGVWSLGGITFDPPTFPDVHITLQERVNCG